MTNTITPSEVKILLPQIVEKRDFSDTIVVAENGKPLAALIPADDYIFLMEARRRSVKRTPEEMGWPPNFFEETAGCFKDEPLVREPQGEYEVREELA